MTGRYLAIQAVFSIVLMAAGGAGDGSAASAPVVQIDGVTFTRADVDAARPTLLFQARNTFYEAERKAVDEFVNEYLLERQAQKERLTIPELLQRHVNSTLEKDPSEDALKVYYEGVDTKEPYEAVRDKILDAVRQRRLARAKAAYLQSLRGQVTVAFRLNPPRAAISLKDTPIRGLPGAPVVLVEYADYECPYCKQIQPALQQLRAEYGTKLALAFKDTPLPMHANAQKAAEAAHCAGAQGKYWEYHDLLFSAAENSLPKLKEMARSLQMDGQKFDACLDSGVHAPLVTAQLGEAQALGLPGTPAFFVNGRLLNPNGVVDIDTLRRAVEQELRDASANAEVLHKKGTTGKSGTGSPPPA